MYKVGSDVFTSKKNARKHHLWLLRMTKDGIYDANTSFYKIWINIFRLKNTIEIKHFVVKKMNEKRINVYYNDLDDNVVEWNWVADL